MAMLARTDKLIVQILTTNREHTVASTTTDRFDSPLNVDEAVRDRYSAAAQAAEAQLCCPVDYDPKYLEVIPDEIIERDYGCGDPSQHLQPGDTVLDLGSGGGKICYIVGMILRGVLVAVCIWGSDMWVWSCWE